MEVTHFNVRRETKLNELKARLFIGLLLLECACFGFFSVYMFINDFVIFSLPQCFFLVVNMAFAALLWKNISAFKKIIELQLVYIFTCFSVIVLNAVVYWQCGSTAILYYFALPSCIMLFLVDGRTAFVYTMLGIASLTVVAFLKYVFLKDIIIVQFTEEQIDFLNIAHLIFFFSFAAYVSFCFLVYENVKYKFELRKEESKQHDKEKYLIIYEGIINAMEQEKMWHFPDLSVLEIAEHLNTNINNIYIAIKYYGKNETFTNMVNRYRVQSVKDGILHGEGEKFTLTHLYLQSGFKNQSTFNRVFKQLEGVTPKEYIKFAKSHKRCK